MPGVTSNRNTHTAGGVMIVMIVICSNRVQTAGHGLLQYLHRGTPHTTPGLENVEDSVSLTSRKNLRKLYGKYAFNSSFKILNSNKTSLVAKGALAHCLQPFGYLYQVSRYSFMRERASYCNLKLFSSFF